eukprot:706557-Amphidinium_carterae.1
MVVHDHNLIQKDRKKFLKYIRNYFFGLSSTDVAKEEDLPIMRMFNPLRSLAWRLWTECGSKDCRNFRSRLHAFCYGRSSGLPDFKKLKEAILEFHRERAAPPSRTEKRHIQQISPSNRYAALFDDLIVDDEDLPKGDTTMSLTTRGRLETPSLEGGKAASFGKKLKQAKDNQCFVRTDLHTGQASRELLLYDTPADIVFHGYLQELREAELPTESVPMLKEAVSWSLTGCGEPWEFLEVKLLGIREVAGKCRLPTISRACVSQVLQPFSRASLAWLKSDPRTTGATTKPPHWEYFVDPPSGKDH